MLVLSRNINEKINIGNDVTVMVIGIKGDRVRIGIQAPTDVEVYREEVFKRRQKEKAETAANLKEMSIPGSG